MSDSENELEKYQKALDRACDQLQHMILGTKPLVQYTPKQWRDILLNDKLWESTEKYE